MQKFKRLDSWDVPRKEVIYILATHVTGRQSYFGLVRTAYQVYIMGRLKVEDLTYDFQPPTYLSGAGRFDEATQYTIDVQQSFDSGVSVKNTASGGKMTLRPMRKGELGLSMQTEVIDGTGELVAVMELADETAEEVVLYGAKRLQPNHHPVESGLFTWAKIKKDSSTKLILVEMTDDEKTQYIWSGGSALRAGSTLLHQGLQDKPVLLMENQGSKSAPTRYSIGPKADPIFMLCIVSAIDRIRSSEREISRMKCCY